MADFKGMEVPIGTVIEVLIPTEQFGIWGWNDDYYGLAFKGKIVSTMAEHFHAEVTHTGFYGAYDYPENEIKGKTVNVVIDPEKVEFAEWSGDMLQIRLGK